MMMHTSDPSSQGTEQVEPHGSSSVVYRASFRPVKATEREPVSKRQLKKINLKTSIKADQKA